MLTVVAAVVESHGKILVCQRRRGDTFGLMWEFPGGKVQDGEATQEALAREIQEELGVEAEIGDEMFRMTHRYAEMSEPIELIFYSARLNAGEIQNLAFETMEWRDPDSLGELKFLPADREFISILQQPR
jgi:8-oxo-dGTP diphosphatase